MAELLAQPAQVDRATSNPIDLEEAYVGTDGQRLKPYEKFAKLIDRHWDGIAAYCRLEQGVAWLR